MDELRHDQRHRQRHSQSSYLPSSGAVARRSAGRPTRLGQTLRDAREDKGLELRDLSVLTNVRVMHLEALETGDFHNLPEDVYSKNFVRLYAQAVGLEPSRMLRLYGQERRSAAGTTAAAQPNRLELPTEAAAPFGKAFETPLFGRGLRLLATLLLVVGIVLVALWAFNSLLFPDERTLAQPLPGSETQVAPLAPLTDAPLTDAPITDTPTPALNTAPTDVTAAPTPTSPNAGMVLLSLRTTPPGAEVSLDGYPFGQSPISDAPVRAGRRTVRLERAGYKPFERVLDLSDDRRLNFELTPAAVQATNPTGSVPAANPAVESAAGGGAAGSTQITVTAEAWLEVYRGDARGAGERLVYETAQPGDTFSFDGPLYVFSGNAGGVTVTRGGAAAALGGSGAVTGQAYE